MCATLCKLIAVPHFPEVYSMLVVLFGMAVSCIFGNLCFVFPFMFRCFSNFPCLFYRSKYVIMILQHCVVIENKDLTSYPEIIIIIIIVHIINSSY